jgi:hypothetical protein
VLRRIRAKRDEIARKWIKLHRGKLRGPLFSAVVQLINAVVAGPEILSPIPKPAVDIPDPVSSFFDPHNPAS